MADIISSSFKDQGEKKTADAKKKSLEKQTATVQPT
jgi:hypothetical protein